jgi:hypothetical protein
MALDRVEVKRPNPIGKFVKKAGKKAQLTARRPQLRCQVTVFCQSTDELGPAQPV